MASPYLTRKEAADYVRATPKAFDHWVHSKGISCVRRGRIRLFRRETLDNALRNEAMKPRRTLRRVG